MPGKVWGLGSSNEPQAAKTGYVKTLALIDPSEESFQVNVSQTYRPWSYYLCHRPTVDRYIELPIASLLEENPTFMIFNTLILGFLVLVIWLLLRRFFFRSVLDNVPGPSPRSFWEGEGLRFKFVI